MGNKFSPTTMNVLLNNARSITMTPEELDAMLYGVARYTAHLVRGETMTRQQVISGLGGSRSLFDRMIAQGVYHPIQFAKGHKMMVSVAEFQRSLQILESEGRMKRKQIKNTKPNDDETY